MNHSVDEALRYLGAGQNPPEALRQDVSAVMDALRLCVQPQFTYRVCSLQWTQEGYILPEADLLLLGTTADTMLSQCQQAVLLACTLGAAFSAQLRSAQARDMAHAVILDACGSALVEEGCNEAERAIAARLPGRYLTDRFSPGYGDLPLSLQPALCATLDTPRRLGLHVTPSFLLNPSKSVTAIIGLSSQPQPSRIRGCEYCSMHDTCALRREGGCCES